MMLVVTAIRPNSTRRKTEMTKTGKRWTPFANVKG
jgi:hypothetical protein